MAESPVPLHIGIDGSISGGSPTHGGIASASTSSSGRFPPPPLTSHPSQHALSVNQMSQSPSPQQSNPYLVQQTQAAPMGMNPNMGHNGAGIPSQQARMSPFPQQQFQSQQQQSSSYYYQQNVISGNNQAGPSAGFDGGAGGDSLGRSQGRSPMGMVNGGHPGPVQGRQTSYNGQAGSFEYASGSGTAEEGGNGNGNAAAGPSRSTSANGIPSRQQFNVHELFRSNPGSAPNPYAAPYQPRPSNNQGPSYGSSGSGANGGMGVGGVPGVGGGYVGGNHINQNQSPYPAYMGNPGPANGGYMGMGMNAAPLQNPYQSMPANGYPPYGAMDMNQQYQYPYPQYPHHNPYYNMHPNNPYAQVQMQQPQQFQQYYQQPPPVPQQHQARQPIAPSPTVSSSHASPYPHHPPATSLSGSSQPPPQELAPELVPPPPISNLSAFSPPSGRGQDLPVSGGSSGQVDDQELSKTPVFASIMRNQRATPPMMVPLQLPERSAEIAQVQSGSRDSERVSASDEVVEEAAEIQEVPEAGPSKSSSAEAMVEAMIPATSADPVAGEFSPSIFHTSRQPNGSEGLTFFTSLRTPAGTPTKAVAQSGSTSERRERRSKGKGRSQEKEVTIRRKGSGRGNILSDGLIFGDFPLKADEEEVLETSVAAAELPVVEPIAHESDAPVSEPTAESVVEESVTSTRSVTPAAPPSAIAREAPIALELATEAPKQIELAQEDLPQTPSIPPPAPATVSKPPTKSWAALVRGPVKPTPKASASGTSSINAAASPMASGVTSPSGSTIALPATSSVYTPSTAPGTPTTPMAASQTLSAGGPASRAAVPSSAGGYAAAAAIGAATPGGSSTPNGTAAWGASARFTYEDMGRLLVEGVLDTKSNIVKANNSPRGLINTGNMCFANSILQVLAYCLPFAGLFEELGRRVTADLGRRTPLIEAMVIFLREFIALDNVEAKLQKQANGHGDLLPSPFPAQNAVGRREPFVPTYVYEAMKENKRFDSMRRGHQEDAEEFLGFFLETLHEELLYLYSRHQSRNAQGVAYSSSTQPIANGQDGEEREVARPVSPSAVQDDGWLEVGKKQKVNVVRTTQSKDSAISRIFGGKLRSVLHTPGQKDSITLEPYQPLQLEIAPTNVITVTDALIHLNEAEVIPGVWSESRKMQVDATKQTFIEILPEMLVLHLKRFMYDGERVVKKGKPIAYGPELVIPTEVISPPRRAEAHRCTYKLIGVVYHHGKGASGGHYTSCVLKQDGTGWLHLDDEAVTEVTLPEVVVTRDAALKGETGTIGYAGREKCPYLLFYQLTK